MPTEDVDVATMAPSPAAIAEVAFPPALYAALVGHGRRKLEGRWLAGEEQAPKAYGLVGGRPAGSVMHVTHVVALKNNLRDHPRFKAEVDRLMDELAVPSETPTELRGWVADPHEILAAERACEASGSVLFGAYHMHRVAWPHDRRRDTCTALDTALAQASGLWVLILSMVDAKRPVLRAFFEGDNRWEARIQLTEESALC